MASLPLYYKNSKPVGLPVSAKTWKDNYLLVIVLVGFMVLIAGTFWFLPPVEDKDSDYERTYGRFTGNPAAYITDAVAPSEPTLFPSVTSRRVEDRKEEVERGKVTEAVTQSKAQVTTQNDGKDEKKEEEEKVKLPVKLEDLIRAEEKQRKAKEGVSFNKHSSPSSETSEGKMNGENKVEGGKEEGTAVVDPVNEGRRKKVVEMIKHAWDGYVQYAFGENELKPITKRGHSAVVFGKTNLGATIVDSLDTLYLTGLHDRFDRGKEWVRLSLDIHKVKSDISVFEFNIRFIGGLLSAYALSGDEFLKDKAIEIADSLMPAFNTPTGIPKSLLNLATGAIKNWGWASGGSSVLAEFGSLHLEFQYLTYLTGDQKYLDKVSHIRQHLKGMKKPDGLYPNFLNPNTGNWGSKHISLGALGDSFYEYLLKSWLVTTKEDSDAKEMYYDAIDALQHKLIQRTSTGLLMVTDLKNGRSDGKMQHLTCFSGGMFALGAQHATNGQTDSYMDIARGVANVCHESYQKTSSKLGPEAFRIDVNGHMTSRTNEKMYLLRPETVETYFYLWRITKDQKYRDWGWEVIEALESKCRISSGGYTGIKDVYNDKTPQDDVQQSFFIAETLKYLFLLFSEDSVLPLDSWVLNTEAHPFPVIPHIPTAAPSSKAM